MVEITWTVEIGLIKGGTQRIGCINREEAEYVKNSWMKNQRSKIRYVHVISGDKVSKLREKKRTQNPLGPAILLQMFRHMENH